MNKGGFKSPLQGRFRGALCNSGELFIGYIKNIFKRLLINLYILNTLE
jgi:hypothetical protein